MDQGKSKLEIAAKIQGVLASYVDDDEKNHVHVFESPAGNLLAVIGSRKFKDMGPIMRQETLWSYLENSEAKDVLNHLLGVQIRDDREYAEEEFRHRSSAAMDMFIRGSINGSHRDARDN